MVARDLGLIILLLAKLRPWGVQETLGLGWAFLFLGSIGALVVDIIISVAQELAASPFKRRLTDLAINGLDWVSFEPVGNADWMLVKVGDFDFMLRLQTGVVCLFAYSQDYPDGQTAYAAAQSVVLPLVGNRLPA